MVTKPLVKPKLDNVESYGKGWSHLFLKVSDKKDSLLVYVLTFFGILAGWSVIVVVRAGSEIRI